MDNKKLQAYPSYLDQEETNLQILQRFFLEFLTHTQKFSPHSLRAYKKDLEALLNQSHPVQNNKKLLEKNKNQIQQQLPPTALKTKSFNQQVLTQKVLTKKKIKKIPLRSKKLEHEIKDLVQQNLIKNGSWKNSTRARKLAAVRTFIKWLTEQKYLKEDFRHFFKSPKFSSPIPYFLSVDEVFSIINMFKKNKSTSDEDKALFFLIYGGGLRVAEACHLKTKDIDWDNKTLKIKGKGGKERIIFLPEYAFSYLVSGRNVHTYFFGKTALSTRKAYDKIRKIGQQIGLSKTLHPHALRHSFATHMLTGGSEIRILQELLGHKSLMATQKYTHLDLAFLDKTLENFHPFNQELQLPTKINFKD